MSQMTCSHDLILGQSTVLICIHAFAAASLVQIFNEAQIQRASAILITLKLGNGSIGIIGRIEADYARTS